MVGHRRSGSQDVTLAEKWGCIVQPCLYWEEFVDGWDRVTWGKALVLLGTASPCFTSHRMACLVLGSSFHRQIAFQCISDIILQAILGNCSKLFWLWCCGEKVFEAIFWLGVSRNTACLWFVTHDLWCCMPHSFLYTQFGKICKCSCFKRFRDNTYTLRHFNWNVKGKKHT